MSTNVWWWNCGPGKETEQPRDNAEVWGVGVGESKRKEYRYSNFKNSCPCKITEMKARTQLVEEAAITCSYCQSNAHSRTVQTLCKLDCSVQTCLVLQHRAKIANLRQCSLIPNRWYFRGPTSSTARPTCARPTADPGLTGTAGQGAILGSDHLLPEKQASLGTVLCSCPACDHYAEPVQHER